MKFTQIQQTKKNTLKWSITCSTASPLAHESQNNRWHKQCSHQLVEATKATNCPVLGWRRWSGGGGCRSAGRPGRRSRGCGRGGGGRATSCSNIDGKLHARVAVTWSGADEVHFASWSQCNFTVSVAVAFEGFAWTAAIVVIFTNHVYSVAGIIFKHCRFPNKIK